MDENASKNAFERDLQMMRNTLVDEVMEGVDGFMRPYSNDPFFTTEFVHVKWALDPGLPEEKVIGFLGQSMITETGFVVPIDAQNRDRDSKTISVNFSYRETHLRCDRVFDLVYGAVRNDHLRLVYEKHLLDEDRRALDDEKREIEDERMEIEQAKDSLLELKESMSFLISEKEKFEREVEKLKKDRENFDCLKRHDEEKLMRLTSIEEDKIKRLDEELKRVEAIGNSAVDESSPMIRAWMSEVKRDAKREAEENMSMNINGYLALIQNAVSGIQTVTQPTQQMTMQVPYTQQVPMYYVQVPNMQQVPNEQQMPNVFQQNNIESNFQKNVVEPNAAGVFSDGESVGTEEFIGTDDGFESRRDRPDALEMAQLQALGVDVEAMEMEMMATEMEMDESKTAEEIMFEKIMFKLPNELRARVTEFIPEPIRGELKSSIEDGFEELSYDLDDEGHPHAQQGEVVSRTLIETDVESYRFRFPVRPLGKAAASRRDWTLMGVLDGTDFDIRDGWVRGFFCLAAVQKNKKSVNGIVFTGYQHSLDTDSQLGSISALSTLELMAKGTSSTPSTQQQGSASSLKSTGTRWRATSATP